MPGTLLPLLALLAGSATVTPPRDPGLAGPPILVTGQRLKPGEKPPEMSGWRLAETEHVLVYSKGSDGEVARTAAGLERLHFLLSVLLNRIDKPDDTLKLRVFLIGDTADFEQLHLGHARYQQGPFPRAFPTDLYYDPRDDGAVIATPLVPDRIQIQRGQDIASLDLTSNDGSGTTHLFAGPNGAVAHGVKVNEVASTRSAESGLYAAFARHYLLTYFPAAYPRWYLEGFGEIFATADMSKDGRIEYGRSPDNYWAAIEDFGGYPLKDLLDGRYLHGKTSQTGWTPFHAWALAHLLFFSDEWKAPLHAYLAAVARGAPAQQAAAALGPTDTLQKSWRYYHGRRVPYEVLSYPAGRFGDPVVRRLTMEEADYVKGRLVLGGRTEIPAGPDADSTPAEAERLTAERTATLERRQRWLAETREAAAKAPDKVAPQLLLAEGECRSGEAQACAAAARTALAAAPANRIALAWNGAGALETALAAPADARAPALGAARREIARANRADTEATVPLLSYYASYADAGEAAPPAALAGLLKADDSVPASPAIGLRVGEALAARGDRDGARRALLPIAAGAYASPERDKARALLAGLPGPAR
ncbi:MAG TPA: hypothetical protein VGC56_02400 [Allosphingosinicella sp.]|jgi:hypothetical protein